MCNTVLLLISRRLSGCILVLTRTMTPVCTQSRDFGHFELRWRAACGVSDLALQNGGLSARVSVVPVLVSSLGFAVHAIHERKQVAE